MAVGREGENLTAVVRQLCAELDRSGRLGDPDEAWLRAERTAPWRSCESSEGEMVGRMREALARLAWAGQGGEGSSGQSRAVRSALDGAELVIWSVIAQGRPGALRAQLPSFAFMVTLPGLGRARALALARRAEELLADREA